MTTKGFPVQIKMSSRVRATTKYIIAVTVFAFIASLNIQPAAAQNIDPALLQQLMKKNRGSTGGSQAIGSPLDQARVRDRQSGISSKDLSAIQDQEVQARLRMLQAEPEYTSLEKDFQKRSRAKIGLYGYDIFGGDQQPTEIVTGRIPDRYILGVGDELIITFQGQSPNTIDTFVDREGRIILPNLKPIVAAGRSFAAFRNELEEATKSALIGTDVYVSLGAVRMISVYVLGEVEKPGLYSLTSLTTALAALTTAGGVKRSGSLRHIRIEHDGKIVPFDIYSLLDGSHADNSVLNDGDRIIVPPLGATIAVTGDVARPAIYELPGVGKDISLEQLLTLAGGTIRPRGYAFVLNRLNKKGVQQYTTVEDRDKLLEDGDILTVGLRQNAQVGGVALMGAVAGPGMRSLDEAPTLSRLLGNVHNLGDLPYLLFGVVETTDPVTRSKILKPFSPEKVLSGTEDMSLHNDDRVVILDQRDIAFLSSEETRMVVLSGEAALQTISTKLDKNTGEPKECKALLNLAQLVDDTHSNRFSAAVRAVYVQNQGGEKATKRPDQLGSDTLQDQMSYNNNPGQTGYNTNPGQMGYNNVQGRTGRDRLRSNNDAFSNYSQKQGQQDQQDQQSWKGEEQYDESCPAIYEQVNGLLPFTLEYLVSMNGAFRVPGIYPVAEKTPVASLIAAAGGTVYNADMSRIELLQYKTMDNDGEVQLSRKYIDGTNSNMAAIFVAPGSDIRISTLFSNQEKGAVLVSGEVKSSGVYSIHRGEKLSELLKRADGLTKQAYPYGAVFTRATVQKTEQAGFKRMARDLDSALATAVLVKRDLSPETLMAARQLSQKLGEVEGIGRVVIEADPKILDARPELDTILEPGDRIYIPKRPNYVLIIGEVLNPGALQYSAGKDVRSYLHEAGGIQSSADKGRVFVVYPNGVAKPVRISSWGGSSDVPVPPGSSIVVPRDATPFDALTFTKDITDILSKLAVSAASLAVITR